MTVCVKVCGIRTAETLEAAIDAGADFLGLIFFPKSPRNVSLEQAAMLRKRAGNRAATVAVTVDASDEMLTAIVDIVQPDYLQLHGSENIGRIEAVRRVTKKPIIKAVKVRDAADVTCGMAFEPVAEYILFDASPPETAGALPGGNGIGFDWRLLRGPRLRRNFILSGGLNPDNVRAAIDIGGVTAVDVSSGVELSPGVKSPELIRRFIAQAKAASAKPSPGAKTV